MGIPLKKKDKGIKGGEILSRILAGEGVTRVFGIIDGTYFGFYATMEQNGIELITPRHESCAAHMAGAYAKSTGTLGVCIASNGPGVANVRPGVAVENVEGNRVLLITSCRRDGIGYPDRGGTFQYFPQTEVTRPITKWSCAVPSVGRVAEILRRALRISWTGRPGVVHIDIPEDIMNGSFDLDPTWLWPKERYRSLDPPAPASSQIDRAVELLKASRLPLLHVGTGVVHAQAYDEVMTLSNLLQAPITTSWGGRSAVDERDRKVISMVYVDTVNEVRRQADLVLILGSRVGETDWWGKPPYWGSPSEQKAIQVDLDTTIIGNNKPVDLAIQADVKIFLRAIIDRLKSQPLKVPKSRSSVLDELTKQCEKRRKKLDKHLKHSGVPMHSAHVATVCQEVFDEDAVMIIDGGNTAIWANFYHQVTHPNTVITTTKMGMLGAGVSQALGAKIAHPSRQVYCIISDGAMGFHPQEIETAVRNDLQVIYLVVCDRQWGMVKMTQQFMINPLKTLVFKSLSPEETFNTELNEIQFDQLARSMGAYGERVADAAGLKGAIERSLASGTCAVIHIDVDSVKHMWAPNLMTFKDMHQEPAGE